MTNETSKNENCAVHWIVFNFYSLNWWIDHTHCSDQKSVLRIQPSDHTLRLSWVRHAYIAVKRHHYDCLIRATLCACVCIFLSNIYTQVNIVCLLRYCDRRNSDFWNESRHSEYCAMWIENVTCCMRSRCITCIGRDDYAFANIIAFAADFMISWRYGVCVSALILLTMCSICLISTEEMIAQN